jgi:hypothetical protein
VEVGVPRLYEYRVFISHVWRTHRNYYDGLVSLLERARRFDHQEIGIPRRRKVNGEEPMGQILEILRTADVLLVIDTPVLENSDNVQQELEEAVAHRIPIIAVTPKGRRGGKHPIIEKHARRAAWMGNSIVAAIREEVAKSRPLRPTISRGEVAPAVEDAYETVEAAAPEARANLTLTPEALEEVLGEDEITEARHQHTHQKSYKDAMLKGEPDNTHVPLSPRQRPWYISAISLALRSSSQLLWRPKP